MSKKRVYISFDYDHDEDLKNLLVGQSRLDDSPFEIIDMSIKEAVSYNWKEYARKRIRSCDTVIVICGLYTNYANGVSEEIRIAQEESVPYFLLHGRKGYQCEKPLSAHYYDQIYQWTWNNIKLLLEGCR